MDSYAKRLKRALTLRDKSQSDLARDLGVRPQAIQYLATRGKGSRHSADIADILGVSRQWLQDGVGPMERATQNSVQEAPAGYQSNVQSIRPPIRSYPIVSWANAGQWEEVIDSYEPGDAEDWYPIPPHIRCSPSSFWTQVQGNSMNSNTGGRSYPHGSFIFIDPEQRDIVTGALVLARLNDSFEATFKRLNQENGRIYLEPLNTQYSVIEIDSDSQIIGTMILAMTTP